MEAQTFLPKKTKQNETKQNKTIEKKTTTQIFFALNEKLISSWKAKIKRQKSAIKYKE